MIDFSCRRTIAPVCAITDLHNPERRNPTTRLFVEHQVKRFLDNGDSLAG